MFLEELESLQKKEIKVEKRKYKTSVCKVCGKRFNQVHLNFKRKTCSNKCSGLLIAQANILYREKRKRFNR